MKRLLALILLCVSLTFVKASAAFDAKEEILKLGRDIGKFEKDVPFFTKSKITVFFSFDGRTFDGAFYGIYLNNDLVKTGFVELNDDASAKAAYIGDFPVKAGESIVTIKLNKGNLEAVKKFQVEIPEYRRVATEFLFAGALEKLRATPRAWIIE